MPHTQPPHGEPPQPAVNGSHMFCPLCGAPVKSIQTVRGIISLMRSVIIALGMIIAALVATYNVNIKTEQTHRQVSPPPNPSTK